MRIIQQLIRSRALPAMPGAAWFMLSKCAACMYAIGKKRAPGAVVARPNPSKEGALKKGDLFPGQRISCDHFSSKVPGRLWTSKNKSAEKYCGGLLGSITPPATSMFVLKSPSLLKTHLVPNSCSNRWHLHVGSRSSHTIG